APGLGRILAGGSVDEVPAFRDAVVRLEVRVAERPCRGEPVRVLEVLEVALAEAREARPVHLRVAADPVVHAGGEVDTRAGVLPCLAVPVDMVDEHPRRIPVVFLAREPGPSLEDDRAYAPLAERARERSSSH